MILLISGNNRAGQDYCIINKEMNEEYFRPWGSYICFDCGPNFQVKRLNVKSGGVLSLQRHFKRAEHWTVVKGVARITLNEDEFDLNVNESIFMQLSHKISFSECVSSKQ